MTRTEPSLPLEQTANVLLVEGQDDKHVVEHLCWKRFDSEPPFSIVNREGFNRLCEAIGPELKAPGRRTVGIIVDANDDPGSRWTAVKDRLSAAARKRGILAFSRAFGRGAWAVRRRYGTTGVSRQRFPGSWRGI